MIRLYFLCVAIMPHVKAGSWLLVGEAGGKNDVNVPLFQNENFFLPVIIIFIGVPRYEWTEEDISEDFIWYKPQEKKHSVRLKIVRNQND